MTRISLSASPSSETPHALTQRHRSVLRDERGFSIVWVGIGFMAFFTATTLAVDLGMLMTARSQAQVAADAAALAGATALAFNDFNDHTATGPAVTSAINTGTRNLVAGAAPSITPPDVTFPPDAATGRNDQVQVTAYRTTARGNAVSTMIAAIYGVNSADVSATATAVAWPADAERCVMPLTIPDKWKEMQTPNWDPTDTFDMYQTQGNKQNTGAPLANPDIYIPPGQPGATGYDPVADKGLQLVLKGNNQNKIAPSMYSPWDLPGSVGGSDYRTNIASCNQNLVKMGDNMTPENGNMVGPTQQGVDDLKAQDPNAHWDDGCKCLLGTKDPSGWSPRIRVVPLYDPSVYASGQQTGKSGPQLTVVNYLGFFIEDVTGGGDVTGRIMPISGISSGTGAPPIGAFAQSIRLVQ
jgi:hypothetical protein